MSGYATVSLSEVMVSGPLHGATTSAQKIEITALARALQLGKGRRINIYTDSAYAFHAVHAHGAIWKERGLLTMHNTPIKHGPEILDLSEAIKTPKQVAITHCRAHQKDRSDTTKGNNTADREAKRAAQNVLQAPLDPSLDSSTPQNSQSELKEGQTPGFTLTPEGWLQSPDAELLLPEASQCKILNHFHQATHLEAKSLFKLVGPIFTGEGILSTLQSISQACPVCCQANPEGAIKPPAPLFHPVQCQGNQPGEGWQIDFAHLAPCKGFKYLLVMTDTFTGWIEAFPTKIERASEVTTTLVEHIIPRFGLPCSLQSDNGPAFISSLTQGVSEALQIKYCLHLAWHPCHRDTPDVGHPPSHCSPKSPDHSKGQDSFRSL